MHTYTPKITKRKRGWQLATWVEQLWVLSLPQAIRVSGGRWSSYLPDSLSIRFEAPLSLRLRVYACPSASYRHTPARDTRAPHQADLQRSLSPLQPYHSAAPRASAPSPPSCS